MRIQFGRTGLSAALVALFVVIMSFIGSTAQAADMGNDAFTVSQPREMTPTEKLSVYGVTDGDPFMDFVMKRATVMPVDAVPAVITLYNADSADSRYILQVRAKSLYGPTIVIENVPIALSIGQAVDVTLNRWNVRNRLDLYVDANGDGVLQKGVDFRIKRTAFTVSKKWASRHQWQPRTLDIVIRGDGGGTTNPPPTGFTSGFHINNVNLPAIYYVRLTRAGAGGESITYAMRPASNPGSATEFDPVAAGEAAEITPLIFGPSGWVPGPSGSFQIDLLAQDGLTVIKSIPNQTFTSGQVTTIGAAN
jgi:hypothetical protein